MGEAPTIVLGGDPASIRAVADWYRSHLAPLAEEAERAVRQVLRDHIESWFDPAGERFAMNLREGLPTILRFVDALHKRARLLDHMADLLEAAQSRIAWVEQRAREAKLKIEDGCIWPPEFELNPEGYEQCLTEEAARELYKWRKSVYEEVRDTVDSVHDSIREAFVGNDNYDWNRFVFPTVEAKFGVTEAWIEKYRGKHNRPHAYGLTWRVCRIGGPVITVLGALDSLAAGDPPEKVIVVTAVSLSVGTASAAIALALAPPTWFWAAPLAGATLGFIASEATSGWYDKNYRTALDKLLAVSPGLDPGSRRLPPIGPGS